MGSKLRDIFTGWEYTQSAFHERLVENDHRETSLFYVILCARFGLEKWEVGCAPSPEKGNTVKALSS
jgi:hypothetical protein